MGLIRKELHPAEINRLADSLRALAHPARLMILAKIAESPTCICIDLSREIGLAQATVSGHLKALKEIGIIRGSVAKNSMCYCIDQEQLAALRQNILQMLDGLAKRESLNCE